jgi:hypothetical protein
VLQAGGTTELSNVVVSGNSGTSSGVGVTDTGAFTLINSIVYKNDDYGLSVESGSSASVSYSDVYGNTTANYTGITDPTSTLGNISKDPSFTTWTDDSDISDDDYTLGSSSPCIDKGSSSTSYDDTDGSRNDMGAYGGPGGDW